MEINPMTLRIIGAGGVTSYFLPAASKTLRNCKFILQDQDKLEPKNLDRQLFREEQVGQFKTDALKDIYKELNLESMPRWFDAGEPFENQDVHGHIIFGAADNHAARRNILQYCDDNQIPCIIGGNEYYDAQAYYYHPRFYGTQLDPRIRYPELMTSNEGNPIRCTGEVLESHPQLAVANQNTAALMLQLFFTHMVYAKDLEEFGEDKMKMPVEISINAYRCHVKNGNQLMEGV